jgi:small subunit ribosomal protein S5
MIRPGKIGDGIKAGGAVRAVVEVAGVKDIVSKIKGSRNKSLNVWAAYKALSALK